MAIFLQKGSKETKPASNDLNHFFYEEEVCALAQKTQAITKDIQVGLRGILICH
jgi:hypothetical protein